MPRLLSNTPKEVDSNISGQLVPLLSHPHREKVIPDVQKKSPVFLFVHTTTTVAVLSLSTTAKSLSLSLLCQVFVHVDKALSNPLLLQGANGSLALLSFAFAFVI